MSLRSFPDARPAPERGHHRVSALFAGIGGIELGLSRAGHETELLCEIEPHARAVLQERFPEVRLASDVTQLADIPSTTSLLTAGFPCQDLSQAGKTAGIGGSNSGLVSHVFRLLRRRRVPWVLLENVSFMLRLNRGEAMRYVIEEMEDLGYRWSYRVMDSRSFGLPQRRERVYLLACLTDVGDPREVLLSAEHGPPSTPSNFRDYANGFYWTEGIRGLGWAVDAVPTLKGGSTIGIPSPPAIWMPDGSVGTPDIRDAERLQGFPADWTIPALSIGRPGRRWKLVGNAVSVDAAAWIGARMRRPEPYDDSLDPRLANGAAWPDAAWSMEPGRRFRSAASRWPVVMRRLSLAEFLKHPLSPLSERATAGFLSRVRSSSLRFPDGLIADLNDHLECMRRAVAV
jgi:DNA (cytosine-5)-methyltransferase 1